MRISSRRHMPLILFAAAGLILFWIFYYGPLLAGEDPEATAHRIDRKGAEQTAVEFIKSRLPEGSEVRSFSVYAAEREAFGYLYDQKAVLQFSELFQNRLPLELYRVEVVEAESDSRHTVDVNPYTGQPVEWDVEMHGNPLSEEQLVRQSEAQLAESGLMDIAQLVTTDTKLGETVYDLTIPELKGASVQVTFGIDSLGVRSLQTRWYAPDEYVNEIARQDNVASLLGLTGQALSIALQIAAFIYALRFNKKVSWRRGIAMSTIFAVLYCINNINMYPGVKAMVLGIANGEDFIPAGGEKASFNLFGMIAGLMAVNLFILLTAVGLYFCFIAGERLCRSRGWSIWPAESDADYGNHIVRSMWKGYAIAFGLLGLQSIIYLGAEKGFRTWYTIDSTTSSLNLVYPVLMPLLAWCAAISEEGVYRLFGISALKTIFRFTALAAVVSSFIWALGHVQYPIYPYYTRLVEVTLLGLLFSYVFLKHGLMTVIYAHAVADTIWMGISITANQPSAVHWTFFAVYLVLPIVIAYAVAGLRRLRIAPAA